jgi:four helix bundle protein
MRLKSTTGTGQSGLIVGLTFEFVPKINSFTEFLLAEKRKFNTANRLFSSCSSIGADGREDRTGENRNDFIHKIKIAAKETVETTRWLPVCDKPEIPTDAGSLPEETESLSRNLSKIISTSEK